MQILSGCSVLKMTAGYQTQFLNVDRISAMQIRGKKFCLHLLYIYADACLSIPCMHTCIENIFHINTVFLILSRLIKLKLVIILAHAHHYKISATNFYS